MSLFLLLNCSFPLGRNYSGGFVGGRQQGEGSMRADKFHDWGGKNPQQKATTTTTPSAFMQGAEGLSCLDWKEPEEVIMLSK